ncbi:hydrolase [Colwellia sp. 75C3]|uniref:serine hydrolase domain-containing protein n=1 Tax=Colwellia sp. 75C3 TaxID=888425 RepID=UPI000C32ED0B|nr:serine hydrolase [Colwellia sp. 75C3]PKG86222.1 hydrolase [Colwellia sp. 75C3]
MVINLKLKNLIITFLVISFSNIAVANVEDKHSAGAEVSVADAKLTFWDMALLKNDFIDSSPADRKDDIAVGELDVDGGNKAIIINMAQEISDNNNGKFDSVLISHKNKLIFESYYGRGRINLPHFQSSVTKSYLSIAVGRAIQLGYLTMADLNKPVVSFIKGVDLEKIAAGAENITLHQVMSMRSGIRVSAEKQKIIMDSSTKTKGSNVSQQFLQHSDAISPESQTFKYQDADPRITMQVLNSVVPGSAKDFIKNEVLAKMNITDYGWKEDVNGLLIPESTSHFTSRDMLKLGTLVLNKGKWQGEQLISAAFLSKATSNITKPTEDWISESFSYGYFWYQTELIVKGKSYHAKFAWGGGEQYIITFEALDLTVVFTAHARENNTMQVMAENILPAFIQ